MSEAGWSVHLYLVLPVLDAFLFAVSVVPTKCFSIVIMPSEEQQIVRRPWETKLKAMSYDRFSKFQSHLVHVLCGLHFQVVMDTVLHGCEPCSVSLAFVHHHGPAWRSEFCLNTGLRMCGLNHPPSVGHVKGCNANINNMAQYHGNSSISWANMYSLLHLTNATDNTWVKLWLWYHYWPLEWAAHVFRSNGHCESLDAMALWKLVVVVGGALGPATHCATRQHPWLLHLKRYSSSKAWKARC